MLATNRDELTSFHRDESLEDLWNERAELLHAIRAREHHRDANAGRPHILLKRQTLINCDDASSDMAILDHHRNAITQIQRRAQATPAFEFAGGSSVRICGTSR